ncbi:MAG TPA: hypothetical protein DCL15_14670 [Chloroflexi bacterium]|nr:hypothetical protein [Chloroflexota bacterium]
MGAMLEIGVGGYADPQYLLGHVGATGSQTGVRAGTLIVSTLTNARQRIVKMLSDVALSHQVFGKNFTCSS